jgi:hypothetical protein
MRKSLTWAAVGTTVAVAALSSVAAGAANASTTPKVTLSIHDNGSSVNAGSSAVISGTLSKGSTVLGNELVKLDTVGLKGKLTPVADTHTGAKTGDVSFKVTPHATTAYELVFPGARGLAYAHSGTVKISVKKLSDALSISTPTTPVTVGTKETFTGTLVSGTTPLAGRTVELWTENSKKQRVHEVGHGTTSATGTVSISTTPPAGTDWYALVYGGDWKYKATVSGIETVKVNKVATTLTLSSSATAPVAKNTHVELTATLTAGTADLAKQTVVLQVLTSKGWVNADGGAATTGSNGTHVFTKAPSVTTSYRVHYLGTSTTYAAAYSATVVVTIG